MDATASIKERIAQFRGYATLDARRDDDELIRSYVGEALAALEADHMDYFPGREAELQNLVIRAGFMNQMAFRAFEYAKSDPTRLEPLVATDLELLDLADKAKVVAAADAGALVDAIVAAFDKRDAFMRVAGGATV